MKKPIIIFCILFYTTHTFCQNINGNWEGILQLQGQEIPIIFHLLKDTTGKYSANFDSPKQNAFALPCSEVIINTDSIILVMPIIKGRYAGKLNETSGRLTGYWYQNVMSFPLILQKTGDLAMVKKINRPQTPKPPYSYKSEDIIYFNAGKSMQFGATFTVPLPDTNVDYFRTPVYPTVILITGSGKQDRDETIFNHKPFAVIADHLTRHGIAVLRVDDRDIGKTTGNFNVSTTADFANDVQTGIDYLKTRNDVDTNNIGLIGHSEGGLIAPMLASKRKDVRFIILLAGPGINIIDMMEQQSADIMESKGISVSDITAYRPLYKNTVTVVINARDSATASQQVIPVFKKWQTGKSALTIKNTTGVENEKDISAFAAAFIKELSNPWLKYFLKLNPGDYLAKTNCPVLALNGEKDIQVAANPNLTGIKNALEKNNNKNFKVIERPGLNHLFQHCKTCTLDEYGQLEETFDIETLKIISDWILTERFN